MKIGSLDTDKQVLVIAEIGNNHEGDYQVAREMLVRAARCGVDAVKFQTFRTEQFVSQANPERFARLKSFELTFEQFAALSELAHEQGVLFISTPLDLTSAEFLTGIVDAFKIASSDNTFYPLLRYVARTGKPMIVSTGLSDVDLIADTLRFVETEGRSGMAAPPQLALLHCVTSYPVPPEQANLLAIRALREAFDYTVGYSDHTIGIEASLMAVALGARIVEKHFTLDKNYSSFRDHQLSADPREMKRLVGGIRKGEQMLGAPEKSLQPAEAELIQLVRRSIVSARDLPAGHQIVMDDLMWTRPAGGLAPGQEDEVVGKRLVRDVAAGAQILGSDVE